MNDKSKESNPSSHQSQFQNELKNFPGNCHKKHRSKSIEKLNKNEHIEKLLNKIIELQLYNGQFAQENEQLYQHNCQLQDAIKNLNQKLIEIENRECEICKNWYNERISLLKINKNLTEDVSMLKTLVYRLNVQLERYQDKFDENSIPSNVVIDAEKLSKDWGDVNSHTLGPLLNAYEQAIEEKTNILEQHENELNRFTGQFKKIIAENTELHQKINDLKQEHANWKEEKTRLHAQLDVYRAKAEVQTKRADLAKEKLTEVLRSYEQKIQSQNLDIERLQEAYARSKGEIITLRSLQQQHNQSLSEGVHVDNTIKEYQKLFEELKSTYENEKKKLNEEIFDLKRINGELEQRLNAFHEENLNLKELRNRDYNEYEELKRKNAILKQTLRKLKESKDKLKLQLQNTTQWVKNLEEGKEKLRNTWTQVQELETIIRHKEAQIKGLHARYALEIGKLEEKLQQKEQTIRKILKEKIEVH